MQSRHEQLESLVEVAFDALVSVEDWVAPEPDKLPRTHSAVWKEH